MTNIDKIAGGIGRIWFYDRARPVEWLSLLAMSGWLQVMISTPEVLSRPTYAAFSALPSAIWAVVFGSIILGQLIAMMPAVRHTEVRRLALLAATGVWTIIAYNFWSTGDTTPISARTCTSIAIGCAMARIYLGWTTRRS